MSQPGKPWHRLKLGTKKMGYQSTRGNKIGKIAGKVITVHALYTKKHLAQTSLDEAGDYVFPVKENQPALYKNIQSLFAPEYPKPGFGITTSEILNT